MGYVTQAKQALVTTLRTTDPDRDTLCEGWNTRRLLAHLVQREQGPVRMIRDAAAKKPPGQEPGLSQLADGAATETGYQDLITRFEAGPPRWSPMNWAAEKVNLVEYVIHNEDVRRGGAQPADPRPLPEGEDAAIFSQLKLLAKLGLRQSPVGVVLTTPSGQTYEVKKGDGVTLSGSPVELALYVSGRREAAHVDITGTDGAVAGFTTWVATQ